MFGRKKRENQLRYTSPPPSRSRATETQREALFASTQPVATLPGGYQVRFTVRTQNEAGESPIQFNWDPQMDPMSFVDIACDQLAFALDIEKFPYGMAPKSSHEYVESIGGISWTPDVGRDVTEPKKRILEEFGDDVEVLASSYGALRQGLRMWSLHLSESSLYIMSEGNSEYRHKAPLSHLFNLGVKEVGGVARDWSIIEAVDESEVQNIPVEERVIHANEGSEAAERRAPYRAIGFFKLGAQPGWVEFSEALVLAQCGCVPSKIETFSEPGYPLFTGLFLSTKGGKVLLPKDKSDFELAQRLNRSVPEFKKWEESVKATLPEWSALK